MNNAYLDLLLKLPNGLFSIKNYLYTLARILASIVDNYKQVKGISNVYIFFFLLFIVTVLVIGKITRLHVPDNDRELTEEHD